MPVNNVTEKPDGRYRYRYTDASGKPCELNSRKGEGKGKFKKRCELAESMAQTKLGSDLTFGELFSAWQEQYQEMNCSASDKRNMNHAYSKYVKPNIGYLKASDITKSDTLPILTYVSREGCSASILSKVRQCISRPYNWAINILDMPLKNPVLGLKVTAQVKSTGHVRFITDKEWELFLTAAESDRYYWLYQALWFSGLRPSEGLGLQVSDFRKTALQIRRGITKDGLSTLKTARAIRDIPMSEQLNKSLENAIKQMEPNRAGWIFAGKHGRQPSMEALTSAFQRTRLKAGVDFTLYDFRHSFGTRMAEANMSHKSLQVIMGHSDISVTMRYYVGSTPSTIMTAKGVMEDAFKADSKTENAPCLPRIGLVTVPQNDLDQIKEAT